MFRLIRVIKRGPFAKADCAPAKMNRNQTKQKFLALTNSSENQYLDEFLEKYDWNLERCVNRYFDMG